LAHPVPIVLIGQDAGDKKKEGHSAFCKRNPRKRDAGFFAKSAMSPFVLLASNNVIRLGRSLALPESGKAI
jgi:hypothetical protein